MEGVLISRLAVMMISRNRGIPRVTLASLDGNNGWLKWRPYGSRLAYPLPALWKVLRVICVEGSPIDCAASRPTASPGSTIQRL